MKNFVSVVVPTYREEKYIEECLKNIKNQDYDGKFEIILVDSNSHDRTRDIAKKYVTRIINIKERGVANALNVGIKNAKGDIMIFVEADVRLYPNFIKEIMKKIKERGVVAVTGILIPFDGNVFHKLVYYLLNVLVIIFAVFYPLFPQSSVAYKKKYLTKAGGFDREIGIGEDLDVTRRVKKYGKCVICYVALAKISTRRLIKGGILKQIFLNLYWFFNLFLLNKKHPAKELRHTEEL